jgi:hypothetical protein
MAERRNGGGIRDCGPQTLVAPDFLWAILASDAAAHALSPHPHTAASTLTPVPTAASMAAAQGGKLYATSLRELLWLLAHGTCGGRAAAAAALAAGAADARNRALYAAARVTQCMLQALCGDRVDLAALPEADGDELEAENDDDAAALGALTAGASVRAPQANGSSVTAASVTPDEVAGVMQDLRTTPPQRGVRPAWMHDRVRDEVAAALLTTAQHLHVATAAAVGLQEGIVRLLLRLDGGSGDGGAMNREGDRGGDGDGEMPPALRLLQASVRMLVHCRRSDIAAGDDELRRAAARALRALRRLE